MYTANRKNLAGIWTMIRPLQHRATYQASPAKFTLQIQKNCLLSCFILQFIANALTANLRIYEERLLWCLTCSPLQDGPDHSLHAVRLHEALGQQLTTQPPQPSGRRCQTCPAAGGAPEPSDLPQQSIRFHSQTWKQEISWRAGFESKTLLTNLKDKLLLTLHLQ